MSDWGVQPLGSLATIRRGISYTESTLQENLEDGCPYINMKSFIKDGGYNKKGLKFFSGFFTKSDLATAQDLLLANTDVTLDGDIIGVPAYLPDFLQTHSVLFSHHVTRLSLNNQIHPKYLYYLLCIDTYRRWMRKYARGTTVLMLDMDAIKKIPFQYPESKTRQGKIAAILTSIDAAIEKTEALIEKYQQIKVGLMHDLFTRGVLTNGQLRPPRNQAPELYQETAIGWIPKDWHYELLDKLAVRGSGHTPNKDHAEYWNGGIKWVSLADSYRLDQLYISDTDLKISIQGIQNSSAVLHPAGIVVLSRDAGVGKSAITTEPMAVSQHFMCWKCDQKMDNYFLYYWLQYNKRTFENIAMGSTILTIGLPYFKRLKIACPVDIKEQRSIATKLKMADMRLFSLQDDLIKKRQQKLGLMQDLLTGKVPVKVDDQVTEAFSG